MYTYITSLTEFSEFQKILINRVDNYAGFDTETSGLDPFIDIVRLIQIEIDNHIFIFDTQSLGDKNSEYVCSLILESGITLIGFNLKFDVKFIKNKYNVILTHLFDLQFAEIMSENGLILDRYPSLEDICLKYLGVQLDKTAREGFYKNFTGITQSLLYYAAEDVMYLKKLKDILLEKICTQKQETVFNLERKLIPVTSMMELEGILLDRKEWEDLSNRSAIRRDELYKEIKDYIIKNIDISKYSTSLEVAEALRVPVRLVRDKKYLEQIDPTYALSFWIYERMNPNSNPQIKSALNLLGIPVNDTGEDTLVQYSEEPLVKLILDYRENSKRVTTYGLKWFEDIHPLTGRIHSKFNQLGTVSGRYSSDSINLQNVPKLPEYRAAFKARPGYKLLRADYNQEEYRLVGEITGDKFIIEAYQQGKDMHTATAALVNNCSLAEVTKELRDPAKNINFASLYGAAPYGLSKKLHIPLSKAEEIVSQMNAGYATMNQFRYSFGLSVLQKGFTKTLLGRKRFFERKRMYKDMQDMEREDGAIMREGYNMLIQGTAADIIKIAMCELFYDCPFKYEDFHMLLQVHDEIVMEVKEEIVEEAKKFMEEKMLDAERTYLKVVPSAVEITVADYWSK